MFEQIGMVLKKKEREVLEECDAYYGELGFRIDDELEFEGRGYGVLMRVKEVLKGVEAVKGESYWKFLELYNKCLS